MPFFIIFVMIPLTELFVFMLVGGEIGLFNTLALALFTAILGGMIVKKQGLETLFKAQAQMRDGVVPTKELFDGLCLVAAGATLITPGFVTDTIGFLLLVPAFRAGLRETLARKMDFSTSYSHTPPPNFRQSGSQIRDPDALDGEYETVEEDQKDPQKTGQKTLK